MALSPGTRLDPYEVTALIGEGGMGAVYRATDTSLGRQVAIKVLPDVFAQDAGRLARLEREAKTLAALNHPHLPARTPVKLFQTTVRSSFVAADGQHFFDDPAHFRFVGHARDCDRQLAAAAEEMNAALRFRTGGV